LGPGLRSLVDVVVFFLWIFFLQNLCHINETDESAAKLKSTLVTSVENTMVTLGNANFGSAWARKEDTGNIVGSFMLDGLLLADVVLLQEGAGNLNLHLVSGSEEGAEGGAA